MAVLDSEPLLDQRLRDKKRVQARVRKLLFLLPSSENQSKEEKLPTGSLQRKKRLAWRTKQNQIAISVKKKFRFARSLRSLSIYIGRATDSLFAIRGKKDEKGLTLRHGSLHQVPGIEILHSCESSFPLLGWT